DNAADIAIGKALGTDPVLLVTSGDLGQIRVVEQDAANITHSGQGGANDSPFQRLQLKKEQTHAGQSSEIGKSFHKGLSIAFYIRNGGEQGQGQGHQQISKRKREVGQS